MAQPIGGYSGSANAKGSVAGQPQQTEACKAAKAKEKTEMKLFESEPGHPTEDEQTQMLLNSLDTIAECDVKPWFKSLF
jgi:hypothetical protein